MVSEEALDRKDEHHQTSKKKKKKRKTTEVEMDFVSPQEGLSCPFVGYFPSGFDPLAKEGGQEESGGRTQIIAYQNGDRFKTWQYQVVATPPSEGVDFVGSNYMGEAAVWQPGSYALGLFNKDSHSLKLLPLSGAKIFRMEPRVRGVDYEAELTEDIEIEAFSKEDMTQKRNLLTATFGTRKNRRMLSRQERGRVKEEALGDQEEIQRLFEQAGKNKALLTRQEALEQANSNITRNVPPYDLSATSPDKAYVFEKIITKEEQKSLGDVKLLMAAARDPEKVQELRELNEYPEFVLNRVHRLKIENDDEGNIKRATILSYIRHLLAFYGFPRHRVKFIMDPLEFHGEASNSRDVDLREYLNIPHAVVVRILKLFTTQSQSVKNGDREVRIMTRDNINLLVGYILILGLMVDGFQADPYDLALALKTPVSKLRPHYLELGCKFHRVKLKDRVGVMDPNSAENMCRVTLEVPLVFPKIRAKRRR